MYLGGGDFLQNGRRRPFCTSKIHVRSHFWPFQIDTQLYFLGIFFTKWMPSAILDVWNSLSIAFLAILDQYRIIIFGNFYKMAAGAHFGCPKFTFVRIPGHIRSIRNFFFWHFWPNVCRGHFGCPQFTFDRISGHLRSIRNFIFFEIFTKWPPADILDVRKSLLIAFLAISDRSAILDVRNSLSMAFLAISDPYGS